MKNDPQLVTITLNGKAVQAPKGESLLKYCIDQGLEVPHYCYHPGIGIDGNCRMCLVEMKGARGPVPSCATFIAENMEVTTESPKITAIREQVMEFYLTNHPLDCPFCDKGGECPLQNYTMKYHAKGSRFTVPKNEGVKHERLGEHIVFDSERCILCTRCVRYYGDVVGEEQLGVKYRGSHAEVTVFEGKPLTHGLSGNLADFCPVGALTSAEYRFVARPWELMHNLTACAGCSAGCPADAWRMQNHQEVLRLTAHQDSAREHYWLCDEGRYLPNRIKTQGRLLAPAAADRQPVAWRTAIDHCVKAVGNAKPVVVVSPQWTREELAQIQSIWGASALVSPMGDALLASLRTALSEGWISGTTSQLINDSDLLIEQVAQPDDYVGLVYRLRLRAAQRRRARPWLASHAGTYHSQTGAVIDAAKSPLEFLKANPDAKDVVFVADEACLSGKGFEAVKAVAAEVKARGGRFALAPMCAAANAMDQAALGIASFEKTLMSGAVFLGLAEATPHSVIQKIKSEAASFVAAFSVQPSAANGSAQPVQLWIPAPAFYETSGRFTNLAGETRILEAAAQPPKDVPQAHQFLGMIGKPAHGHGISLSNLGQGRQATA